MASPTYTTRALVLRKTKLGETDLVVTLLAQDGSQVRAVAKGARKPANVFSARLELYSVVDVLCSKGRSLDVVSEARLVASNERVRLDLEHAAAAAPMAELLDRMTHDGLENPRLFACTEAVFARMGGLPGAHAPLMCAAHLLKALALSGLRPSLDACVACGAPAGAGAPGQAAFVSCREGGVVCPRCRAQVEAVAVPASTLEWMRYLLGATFSDVAAAGPALDAAFAVLRFCREWVREHVGCTLKSLDFLFSCGLYEDAGAQASPDPAGARSGAGSAPAGAGGDGEKAPAAP